MNNVTKQTGYIIAAIIIAMIVAVTVLLILGRDPDRLIELITVGLIPLIGIIWAGNRADKSVQVAERAAESAEQAVHNTNGRMGQLIQDAIDRGTKIDVDEYHDVIKHNDIVVPEEQAIHSAEGTERTQHSDTGIQ